MSNTELADAFLEMKARAEQAEAERDSLQQACDSFSGRANRLDKENRELKAEVEFFHNLMLEDHILAEVYQEWKSQTGGGE